MKWFWRALEIAIGLLFVYAGGLKAWDPLELANDIDHYHIVPWTISVRAAFYLPWIEILCGLALILRRFAHGARLWLTLMMIVFIVATLMAKARGIDLSCGCFGHAARNLSFATHMAIDLAILGGLCGLFWREKRIPGNPSSS